MNFPEAILKNEEKAIFRLRSLYRQRGYEPYKMSKFEEYDLYVRNKSFLVSDNVITFTDTDGKLMALKPDVTLSIVKNTREGETRKVYYNENVYRVSEGSHSYKEIMQTGLECIGTIDLYALSEVLTLAVESLGAISDDYLLDVSHLGITLTLLKLSGAEPNYVKRILECMGEKNLHGITSICREAGVSDKDTERIKTLVKCYGKPSEVIEKLRTILVEEEFAEALDGLETVLELASSDRIRLDFSVVGDISYYNGIVFKGFVNGIPSAVLSGGEYDELMKRFGRTCGAIGFAVYLDLLENFSTVPEYDVDTLVVYGDRTPAGLVADTVRTHISQGETVRAEKCIPEKLKYKTLVELTEE
ncbi:MAG: ATP phosphoribosyltransferase regulatory subunit [Clostridia bacterium]|nr:ATP phosphoribosyltransferase regulatory subunit [Clostridia bacterium]